MRLIVYQGRFRAWMIKCCGKVPHSGAELWSSRSNPKGKKPYLSHLISAWVARKSHISMSSHNDLFSAPLVLLYDCIWVTPSHCRCRSHGPYLGGFRMFCGYALVVSCDKWVLNFKAGFISRMRWRIWVSWQSYLQFNRIFQDTRCAMFALLQCLKAGVKSPRLPRDR